MNLIEQEIMNVRRNAQILENSIRERQMKLFDQKRMNESRVFEGSFIPPNLAKFKDYSWGFEQIAYTTAMAPNTTQTISSSISQEAAFIWTHLSKQVFIQANTNEYTYVDPYAPTYAARVSPGLSLTIRDPQSDRQLIQDPIPLDDVGDGIFPSPFMPMLFLNSSQIEAIVNNDNAANTYLVFLTFYGFKIRVDDLAELSSTVYAK